LYHDLDYGGLLGFGLVGGFGFGGFGDYGRFGRGRGFGRGFGRGGFGRGRGGVSIFHITLVDNFILKKRKKNLKSELLQSKLFL
jgi:hypothetical protein